MAVWRVRSMVVRTAAMMVAWKASMKVDEMVEQLVEK